MVITVERVFNSEMYPKRSLCTTAEVICLQTMRTPFDIVWIALLGINFQSGLLSRKELMCRLVGSTRSIPTFWSSVDSCILVLTNCACCQDVIFFITAVDSSLLRINHPLKPYIYIYIYWKSVYSSFTIRPTAKGDIGRVVDERNVLNSLEANFHVTLSLWGTTIRL